MYLFAEIQTKLPPNACYNFPVHIPPPDYDLNGNLDLSPELPSENQLQVHHQFPVASNSFRHGNKHRCVTTPAQRGKNKRGYEVKTSMI